MPVRAEPVRIVSWNLARNTTSRSNAVHERAWHYLVALDPDMALVQEAVPPTWVTGIWDVVKADTGYWGSAILAKPRLRLEALFAGDTHWDQAGYLATAAVTFDDGEPLVLGSVHAPLMRTLSPAFLAGFDSNAIKMPGARNAAYYDVPYALYRRRTKSRFLVSGDWNVSPELWDAHHTGARQRQFFERARANGWIDCYRRFHPDEGRTWFRGTDRPYQMDHAFCDPDTADALKSCEIDAHAAALLGLSDHAALVIEIELGREGA